ncbi:citron Rho-interacting kinase-like [Venturia canescens]|uniref:citron Rho-interacting kinase-like n=1 Tax=Venturia canescens TaxID=32260 RepID=UPI001C9C5208|nr:citron Rho-interacting kinase-like [Venturia canescens]
MVTRQKGKPIAMVRDMDNKTLSPSRALLLSSREVAERNILKEAADQTEKFSKEMLELSTEMEYKKKEYQDRHKKLLELQDKATSDTVFSLESQLEEKNKKLEVLSKERDKLERELVNCRSDIMSVKRTLDLERQERKELETRALDLIKRAKRKWEVAEKEKIDRLNKHIEVQTVRITELCTSNNEMSSKLQRTQCELETVNAELHKLKVFQIQYKESLAKTRELNRQSAQGVENKLEEIANRTHNQLAEIRLKLEMEIAKSTELEAKLRHEEDTNHCRQSRLNVALELAQSELKDCQEELRSTKAMIPARDTEIETLRNQLKERSKQLENIPMAEQTIASLQDQLEKMRMENERLRSQLEMAKSDLNETLMTLERKEALTIEKIGQDKETLEQRLQHSLAKEEEQLRKVGDLEELLRRLEQSVTKLEAENASLKRSDQTKSRTSLPSQKEVEQKIAFLEHQVEKLEQQLQASRDKVASERQIAKQAQTSLWKKEKELSDANLDKRIAMREAKTAEERIKMLQEDKQKLSQQLNTKFKEEEEKSKRLLIELESAKSSLAEITREATRNKLQADSAQKALTQANKQIEELQSSSASLRRELDSTRKQMRDDEDRLDKLIAENKRLTTKINKFNEERNELECKLQEYEQSTKSQQVNINLLKETCTVLEEQLTDYERLTSDHETRENTLIQERMKLQKELESVEQKLREAKIGQNEEKTRRLVAERAIERLEAEMSDVETERSNLSGQRDQYKKLAQDLTKQVAGLSGKCAELECDLGEVKRALETARGESRVVKEECSQHLTRMHELKEANMCLMEDLQANVDQGQELRIRIAELESVLDDIRQFYQEREVKAEGTRYQQTKLIDYLTLKLEEAAKRKKTVCDKIFGSGKQKENVPPTGTGMPVGYRELENQLASERAKVKTLTEQLLAIKAEQASNPIGPSPLSPESKRALGIPLENGKDAVALTRQTSIQRMRHNIPHRFNIELSMRSGKCAACLDTIQFGKRAAVCSECQIISHPKCSLLVPPSCGLPGDFAKHMSETQSWKSSDSSITNLSGSVQTLALDEPDNVETEAKAPQKKGDTTVHMEGWVKVPGRAKVSWDRKYLRLEGTCLCIYEHQPSPGMAAINRLDLDGKHGFTITENVQVAEVVSTAKSDLPFVFRVESNSSTTCWPSSRFDVMTLSQIDKKNWLKALKNVACDNGSGRTTQPDKFQTIMRLEKNRLDVNCILELEDEKVLLLGAEEGLFSYRPGQSHILTKIRGVKKVHQLSLHPHLGLALMIAGEDRQLVSCDLRQLRSNALAAECSRPAINTKTILTGCESCHLYQIQGEMLCAATATHVVLLKWSSDQDSGEFIAVRELETQEPCSCAIFTENVLVVGCHKFFQIELENYTIDEFPEEDDSSVKAALSGVARLGIFPVSVLNVSTSSQSLELLLCYNEFGVFVNEYGQRTRAVDPTWSHLPFAFAFRKPYLFTVHFSSVEVIKLSGDAFRSASKSPERSVIELNNPRYLGNAGSRGIYVSAVNSSLEILKIDGQTSSSQINGSLTSLDTLAQEDDSSSEFSFTSSLMEALDGQGKKVHFANVSNH